MPVDSAPVSDGLQLPAVIENVVSSVPEGVRARLATFLLKTIGLSAFPSKAREIANELDTMSGRTYVATELAKAAAEELKKDPEQVRRAILRFHGEQTERQENLESIARQAAEEVASQPGDIEPPSEVSDDWRRKFTLYAGDVSEPEMQRVWARLLAGEFISPGSYSNRTLRLVSEMNPMVAQVFHEVAAHRFESNLLFLDRDAWTSGLPFAQLKLLQDWGLILDTPGIGGIQKIINKQNGRFGLVGLNQGLLLYAQQGPEKLMFPVVQLSEMGRELASLLVQPDERPALRRIAEMLRPTPHLETDFAFIGRALRTAGDQFTLVPDEFLWGGMQQFQSAL